MSYLLIGLGNPGKKFESTRHNAGKILAAYLQQRPGEGLKVVETDCYMNESGGWVKRQLQLKVNRLTGQQVKVKKDTTFSNLSTFQPASLFICHDDLDIPLGKFKVQFGKGPRLHNGVLSVEQALGTKEFWRIRIGIENRSTGQQADRLTGYQASRLKNEDSGEDYVLEGFTPEEKKILVSVFPEIRDRLLKKVQPFKAKNVVL